jgi:creatinine amidohydrolase/Fe(II)-dependent formamide hydrolase-like protein
MVLSCLGGSAAAQSTSVMIEDLTTTEIQAAITAGKTTAVCYFGGAHQNGDAVALVKHNLVADHLARRVAEELGNALAYPPSPYGPAGDAIKKTGHMRFAGTVSLTEETFGLVAREVALSALAVGFRNVVLLSDHGSGLETLRKVAAGLTAEWTSRGGRVTYIPIYEEGEAAFQAHLKQMGVPANLHTPIDDASEVMALDRENRWVRKDKLAPEIAKVASASLGQTFIDNKIRLAVASIRGQVGK